MLPVWTKGNTVLLFLLIYQKLSAKVDHSLLIQKFCNIGFDSSACRWFQNYLLGKIWSEFFFFSFFKGVPQESVLGPVLFTNYINDIASALENCHAHIYVDYTVLYCSADTVHLAVENLQLSFTALQNALVDLKLVLNASKTSCLLFY